MNDRREERLANELSNCIARHADWLSGRDFQRVTQRVAAAYFEADDLDELCRPEDFLENFLGALTKELSSLAGDPVEM